MKQKHIPSLVINKMTAEQYEREYNAGRISDDEIYLVPDEAGEGQLQADWNQNDESAPDYVKNRTHYFERTIGELFNEEVFIEMGSHVSENLINLVLGGEYYVNIGNRFWDGLIAREVSLNEAPSIAIGNLTLIADVEDEQNSHLPFCIYETPTFIEFGIVMDTSDDGYYNIAIGGTQETVKVIDSKFLPKSVTNLVAGELPGSLRTIHARPDDEEYKLGFSALATGYYSEASGVYAHAAGYASIASGEGSHAEGQETFAAGAYSHSEGQFTEANGEGSHSEGSQTIASGAYSHAEGSNTIAAGTTSHVQGKYNIEDTEDKYAHIVGNGTRYNEKSNAHTLDWNGLGWFASSVKVGGTGQDDVNAKTLATEEYVNTAELITTADIDSLWGTELLDATNEEVTF